MFILRDDKSGSMDVESQGTEPVHKTYTSYDDGDYSTVTRKVATDPNQNDYDIVKKNNTQDGAMQTPRTVAMQVRIGSWCADMGGTCR